MENNALSAGTLISHADANVVTDVIEKVEEKFGKMTVTRGKEHRFLGMNIALQEDGTMKIGMKNYVKEAIEDFGEDVSNHAATPAKRDLLEIDKQSPVHRERQSFSLHRCKVIVHLEERTTACHSIYVYKSIG